MVNPLDVNSTLDYYVYNICNDREYKIRLLETESKYGKIQLKATTHIIQMIDETFSLQSNGLEKV